MNLIFILADLAAISILTFALYLRRHRRLLMFSDCQQLHPKP